MTGRGAASEDGDARNLSSRAGRREPSTEHVTPRFLSEGQTPLTGDDTPFCAWICAGLLEEPGSRGSGGAFPLPYENGPSYIKQTYA